MKEPLSERGAEVVRAQGVVTNKDHECDTDVSQKGNRDFLFAFDQEAVIKPVLKRRAQEQKHRQQHDADVENLRRQAIHRTCRVLPRYRVFHGFRLPWIVIGIRNHHNNALSEKEKTELKGVQDDGPAIKNKILRLYSGIT